MSYVTNSLPKDAALSVAVGLLTAIVGGVATTLFASWKLAKLPSHDGQYGLGALMFGVISITFWGVLSTMATFVARTVAYRKLLQLEDERAFNEELIAARKHPEGHRHDHITA